MPLCNRILLTDAEFLLGDDGTITVDILANQIVKERTTLTYEHLKCACRGIILVVCLQVLGEVLDTDGEKCDLAFGAACIILALAIFLEDGLLLFC